MRTLIDSFVVMLQSLLLLSYLVRNGSERVVSSSRDHLYDLKALEDYQFRDENNRDQGINGRSSEYVSLALDLRALKPNLLCFCAVLQYGKR